jgi:hypothetical protein
MMQGRTLKVFWESDRALEQDESMNRTDCTKAKKNPGEGKSERAICISDDKKHWCCEDEGKCDERKLPG